MPPKINVVVRAKYIQVFSARIIFIEPYTAVTLDAPVHFVVNKRAEVLVGVRTFFKTVPAVVVA